jgi:hypothetical protein
MPVTDNHNSLFSSEPHDENDGSVFQELLSQGKWIEYFRELSKTLNIELSIYDVDGTQQLITNENPFCNFIRSAQLESLDCPNFCTKLPESNEPEILKCQSKLTCFAFGIERFSERVFIVARGGFAEYDDFLDFMRVIKDNDLPELPISMPLNFPGENYIKAIFQFVYLTISRMFNSVEEKHKLEERLLRMTALFDSQAFRTLSKNPVTLKLEKT